MSSLNLWKGKIWEGVYKTFQDIEISPNPYESERWVEKQIEEVQKIISSSTTNSFVQPIAISNDYVLPIVAALISSKKKEINILDFGGGLAVTYFPLRKMISDEIKVFFKIIENKYLCDIGQKLFSEYDEIYFDSDIPVNQNFDVIHAGSSFHYVEKWKDVLQIFISNNPEFIIFSDLPAGDIKTFVTVQNYYENKIPVNFWNLEEFIEFLNFLGYQLIYKSRIKSNYLEYLKDFPEPYRLDYFSQLIFQKS
jgi:putative methyltransferase (TIGR04325 family)